MGVECGGEGVQIDVHEGVQAPDWVSDADQDRGGLAMSDYLPDVYVRFRERYPGVAQSLDALGEATQDAGGLDPRSQRLVKLGIAIGALAEGAVRSNVRKARAVGMSGEDIRQTALLAISTAGFPTAIAAMAWIEEVLAAE
jgi:4-carboxymuconolactone decarboxylase